MEIIKNYQNKILNKDVIDVVLYHGSCSDGFGSAFVVWNYYKNTQGVDKANQLIYIPCYYQKENQPLSPDFLEQMAGKNIMMCDFAYRYDHLVQLIGGAKTFIILDHHKTAEADLKKIPEFLKIFDMARSGCGITWDYFHPQNELPKLLKHIQDRDIWEYKVDKTLEFVTFFYEQIFDFELWETYLDEKNVQMAIEKGSSWLSYQKIMIDKVIKKTTYVIQEIDNKYQIVLYCNSPDLKSDIGNQVFNKYPIGDFSCVWDYDLYRNQTMYSLRSTNDRTDVSVIAKKFGGGGHRNASGMIFPGIVPSLPLTIVNDPSILELLLHGTKGKFKIERKEYSGEDPHDFTIVNEEYSYVIFKVKEVRPEWICDNSFDLIKRKCADSTFILFENPSNKVDIDKTTGEVVALRDYNLFYNEKSLTKPENILEFHVYCTKDKMVSFTTSMNFLDIIEESSKINMDFIAQRTVDADSDKEETIQYSDDDEEDDNEEADVEDLDQ